MPGESGWGAPTTLPAHLGWVGSDRRATAAVVGMGNQGLAQGRGIALVGGVDLVAVAEPIDERRAAATSLLGLADEHGYRDLSDLLAEQAVDLVGIATTAVHHIDVARAVLSAGVPHLIIEKPFDTSVPKARAFVEEARVSTTSVVVNYSRRWSPDYRGVKRLLDAGTIGSVRSVHVAVGLGELAMIASHYFDVVTWLLGERPASVTAVLEPPHPNRRGAQYDDPRGRCSVDYVGGARATFDFCSDVPKSTQLLLKGERGYVLIDENQFRWYVHADGDQRWEVPFGDRISADSLFARVVADELGGGAPAGVACGPVEALWALEMIIGAHLSSRSGRAVPLPLPDGDLPVVLFP